MYTLYSQLSVEEQQSELKYFHKNDHNNVINGELCVLCGMVLHNCLCSHTD